MTYILFLCSVFVACLMISDKSMVWYFPSIRMALPHGRRHFHTKVMKNVVFFFFASLWAFSSRLNFEVHALSSKITADLSVFELQCATQQSVLLTISITGLVP